jgi:outer membrane protein assembly factor BamE (lipoprotein component of BamABCDE complex)
MKISAWIGAAAAAIGSALLPACDLVNLPEIKPGITRAAEVRARLGEPGFEHHNADGSVTWEYTRQPAGVHCYMITIGSDQIVTAIEQALNQANYGRVREGASKEEIRRLLGAPGSKTVYNNLQEEVWEWRIEGAIPIEESYFMVHFDTDKQRVKKTSSRVAMRG